MSITDKNSSLGSVDLNDLNEAALQNPDLLNNPGLHEKIRQYNFYNLLFLALTVAQLCYEMTNDFDTLRDYDKHSDRVGSLAEAFLSESTDPQLRISVLVFVRAFA